MKGFLIVFLIASVAAATAQTSPPATQMRNGVAQELGPMPISGGDTGRISAIACSRQNAAVLYIGAAELGGG
jgi:hypothetical protein